MALNLDEMRMTICSQPPHREAPSATAMQRKTMLQLALQGSEHLLLDDRELRREGPSYTVDTLRSLKHDYPDASLFMLIGSDSFQALDSWHCWQELLELANIVIARRPDNVHDQASRLGVLLKDRFVIDFKEASQSKAGKIIPLPVSQLEISSTQIRELTKQNKTCEYLLPHSVLRFMKENLLYQK